MSSSYANSVKEYVDTSSSSLSIITVNVTEECQLACPYCPHGHGYDGKCFMTQATMEQLLWRIQESGFSGRVSISGNGEPTLWPYLFDFLKRLPDKIEKRVISNGMTEGFAYTKLSQMCKLIISAHSMQGELYQKMLRNLADAHYTLRNCDPTSEGYELTLTNRGGFLSGEKKNRGLCTIPFYKMFVDYDGSYLLCCDDWLRKSKAYGNNIFDMSINNYFQNQLYAKKQELAIKGRITEPCSLCTVNGKIMGERFVKEFLQSQERQHEDI